MYKTEKSIKIFIGIFFAFVIICIVGGMLASLSGCEEFNSNLSDLKGSLKGNEYSCEFYDNYGHNYMHMHGEKIDLESNKIYEADYDSNGSLSQRASISSVITIIIDGKEVETCGSTVIFAEKGLKSDVNFMNELTIDSEAKSWSDNTFFTSVINKYKNSFGKPRVVIIQSQLGYPICAYSGNSVYYEVDSELPKTTKLSIDGKRLYIHRANFNIIDASLLD